MTDLICSGGLFYCKTTTRFLFLHRTQSKHSHKWGIVGGSREDGETPWQTFKREMIEEIGETQIEKSIPLEVFLSKDAKFSYHTYLCIVKNEFIPKLNHEHNGYAWVTYASWPKPLHYGLKNTLDKKTNKIKLETVLSIYNCD